MKIGGWGIVTWLVIAMAPPHVLAAAPSEKAAAEADKPATKAFAGAEAPAEPRRRLKFKGSGRICVCENPVSESEIEAAMAAAQKSSAVDPVDSRKRRDEK